MANEAFVNQSELSVNESSGSPTSINQSCLEWAEEKEAEIIVPHDLSSPPSPSLPLPYLCSVISQSSASFPYIDLVGVSGKCNLDTKTYKSLSIAEKRKLIEEVRKGEKLKKDIAADFGIPSSTLSTILKNEDSILQDITCETSRKRKRMAVFPDIERSVLTWLEQCKSDNVNLSGPLVKEKAETFAKLMGETKFRASNGWLHNFKKRHGLVFRKVCNENTSVNETVCSEWTEKLQEMLKEYEPQNVFNADETALFFQCTPDKTMCFKDDKCFGGNRSKERLTVLLATNMTGTDKLTPLLIGKSKSPRCFAQCKSFPVDYASNKKAWMNAKLFTEWLNKMDKQMKQEKRRVLLFLDNCSAHNAIPSLQYVTVIFLPPDKVSRLQPLGQGIIKNFKTFYRKEILRQIVSDMEEGKNTSIDLLQAIRMVDKSWRSVQKETIVSCFKACGFYNVEESTPDGRTTQKPKRFALDIDPEWTSVVGHLKIQGTSFEDFVNIDEDVAVMGSLSEQDIADSIRPQNDDDEDNDDEEDQTTNVTEIVTPKEAKAAVAVLRSYVEQCSNVQKDVFSALFVLECEVESQSQD